MGDMTPNEDYNLNAPDGSQINLRDLFAIIATGRLSELALVALIESYIGPGAGVTSINTETGAVTGYLKDTGNLAGLANLVAARSNLGLGTAATQNVGSGASDVAGYNAAVALINTAIGTALLKASNLSDLTNPTTARTNLGLGTAATVNTGTASGDVALLSTGGRFPIARVASGTPTGSLYVRDDGTLAAPPAGGLQRVAGFVRDNATALTYSSGTTSAFVDVDSTNCAFTWTPTATTAEVRYDGYVEAGSSGQVAVIGLRQGTTPLAGASMTGSSTAARIVTYMRLTGLSVGVSTTIKLCYRSPTGSVILRYGGDFNGGAAEYRGPIYVDVYQ